MEERPSGAKPIEGVGTSTAAFIGVALKGPVGEAVLITNFAQFVKRFGGPIKILPDQQEHYLYYAVRNFFTEGGGKCYVVRIMHYGDVDDEATNTGVAASKLLGGLKADGTTTVNDAFTLSAINQGSWGDSLQVQVENSARYSLLLGENLAAAASVSSITLKDNSDVRAGDLLWLVEEVSGEVKSIKAENEIVFKSHLKSGNSNFDGQIPIGMNVFSPGFKFQTLTNQANPVVVTGGVIPTGIKLASVDAVNGSTLKNGDFIHFVSKQAFVVVQKITEKVVNGEKMMVVHFPSQDFTGKSFAAATSRVYARSFDIHVSENGTVLESHEGLSLIPADRAHYIAERFASDSGNSFYITAQPGNPEALLAVNSPAAPLSGGNDGLTDLNPSDTIGSQLLHTGLYALDAVKDASILVVPGCGQAVATAAIAYCESRQDLFFVIDYPNNIGDDVQTYRANFSSTYAAIYYPWIKIQDPFTGQQVAVPPSGAIAGIYADTDVRRGVHKAPAGIENGYVNAASGIDTIVTKGENDILYQDEINVIRKLPEGICVWGARTLSPDPEWKYINVRRLFIFLEQSIQRGTQWAVFEPNGVSLWKSIKRNISAFLKIQWMEGKLVGDTQEQAFYVKCDEETNPPEVVDAGQVITEIGVAPSKPAEFVVFRIRQYAGN